MQKRLIKATNNTNNNKNNSRRSRKATNYEIAKTKMVNKRTVLILQKKIKKIADEMNWIRLCKRNLMREIKSLLITAQNNDKMNNNVKSKTYYAKEYQV